MDSKKQNFVWVEASSKSYMKDFVIERNKDKPNSVIFYTFKSEILKPAHAIAEDLYHGFNLSPEEQK